MKKIFISILIILIIVSSIFLLNPKSYHIYTINCTLTSLNDTCNEKIELNQINIKGTNYTSKNIDDAFVYCKQLNENTWSYGKYLIILE